MTTEADTSRIGSPNRLSQGVTIETVNFDRLIDAPYNPRRMSKEARKGLTKSMETFGNVQPIVWNRRTGHVVSGHQRLSVLREKGEASTQVVVVDLDDVEEKALNVTQNNPQIAGEFTEGLGDVLRDLHVSFEAFADLHLDALAIDLGVDIADMATPGLLAGPPTQAAVLADAFVVPPFSVLDARQGYWKERKDRWLALGIRSELGRGEKADGTGTPGRGHFPATKAVVDHITGRKRTVHGDGTGKPIETLDLETGKPVRINQV